MTIKTWRERRDEQTSQPYLGIEEHMQAEIDELRAALALEQTIRLQCANDSQAHLDRSLRAEAALAIARAGKRKRLVQTCLAERDKAEKEKR